MKRWNEYFNRLLKSQDFYIGYLIGVAIIAIAIAIIMSI